MQSYWVHSWRFFSWVSSRRSRNQQRAGVRRRILPLLRSQQRPGGTSASQSTDTTTTASHCGPPTFVYNDESFNATQTGFNYQLAVSVNCGYTYVMNFYWKVYVQNANNDYDEVDLGSNPYHDNGEYGCALGRFNSSSLQNRVHLPFERHLSRWNHGI